ncbi:hypothetical protein EDF24_2812 [Curtobacterium sp. PhB130]|uniref:hypothetical protein n=1 Tax=Curtobacterium sp. PhB130 TaxID=2485178 RepID=UPI000F4B60AB|nr:hypothetical protein [Curtobacterium sp. PhB130]ROS73811.1 hypothetical protein EDF24_2812 [Curtobacterium sp. PhB130]
MAEDDRDTDLERARLERVAWGSGSSEAEAARARIALADLDSGRRRPARAAAVDPRPSRSGPAEPRSARTASDAPSADASRPAEVRAAMEADPTPERQPMSEGDPGLPSEGGEREPLHEPATGRWSRVWPRVLRVVRSARARPWLAGGAAAAVVVAFGTGLAIGTVHPVAPSSPSVTPTAGTITLQQLLDAPQTYADQLPGSLEAPVSLHTTRLVFTNRSLSGDDAATPWNVWAGVGTDRSTICLVATADRLQATSACYPREDALHGAVSLSASSLSGTLTVNLSGGGVRGTVTNSF